MKLDHGKSSAVQPDEIVISVPHHDAALLQALMFQARVSIQRGCGSAQQHLNWPSTVEDGILLAALRRFHPCTYPFEGLPLKRCFSLGPISAPVAFTAPTKMTRRVHDGLHM